MDVLIETIDGRQYQVPVGPGQLLQPGSDPSEIYEFWMMVGDRLYWGVPNGPLLQVFPGEWFAKGRLYYRGPVERVQEAPAQKCTHARAEFVRTSLVCSCGWIGGF